MMFPFISYLMRHSTIPILPIYVSKDDGSHGAVVEKIWRHSSSTVFVFSSDFCHWGTRFQYCYLAPRCCDPIYMQIEELDTKAMQVLQKFCLQEWHAYLQRYGNTICGKDPLGLLMFLGCFLRDACGARLEWVKYAQSSKVTDMDESSISDRTGDAEVPLKKKHAKSRKSGDAIPNFVYELEKLISAEGLSSALKEKKKRLAGQLVVYNQKRETKGLAPVKCNPIRIGDEPVESNPTKDGSIAGGEPAPIIEEPSAAIRRPFGMEHPPTLEQNQHPVPKPYISSKIASGVVSESRPSLKAETPSLIPSAAVQKKNAPSKDDIDLEYEAFLKSIGEVGDN
ncbi:Protein memo1 [Mitosporidium daphniae]